jgi:hypothetical protein
MLLVTTTKSCPRCHKVMSSELGGCLWWIVGNHGVGLPTEKCKNCDALVRTGKNYWSELHWFRKVIFFLKAGVYSWLNFYVIGISFFKDWSDRPTWPTGESRDYVLYWTIAWYVFTILVFIAIFILPLFFGRAEQEFALARSWDQKVPPKKKG